MVGRASRDQRLDKLGEVTIFRALSRKELESLGRAADTVEVPAGKQVVTQGQSGREFFVLLSGEVSVTVDGNEVAVLKDGEWFGELAIIDPAPRDATVTTLTPCELLVIDGRRFLPLLEELPVLANKILVGLARRVREADQARVWQG